MQPRSRHHNGSRCQRRCRLGRRCAVGFVVDEGVKEVCEFLGGDLLGEEFAGIDVLFQAGIFSIAFGGTDSAGGEDW